jgi:hypothetical protein
LFAGTVTAQEDGQPAKPPKEGASPEDASQKEGPLPRKDAPPADAPPPAPKATTEPTRRPPDKATGNGGLSDAQRLRRGRNLFQYGDCQGVVEQLSDLTLPGRLESSDDLADTHRMLGVCHFQLGQRENAERELKSLLFLKPDTKLDPFLTPPPVVELFDALKAQFKKKLEEIREAKRKAGLAQEGQQEAKTLVVEREVTYRETSYLAPLVPFGFGQFENQEPIKGSIFASLQGLALATNIAAFWTKEGIVAFAPSPEADLRASTPGAVAVADPALVPALQTAQTVQFAALGVFAALYLYGIADAYWNLERVVQDEVKESRRELPRGTGTLELEEKPKATQQ